MFFKKKIPNRLGPILIVLFLFTAVIFGLIGWRAAAWRAEILNYLENYPDQTQSKELISRNLVSYREPPTATKPEITADSPTKGLAEAPITIFEFSSFDCSYSREIQPILEKIIAQYPEQIKLVWKDLPISDQARPAHLAARCAQNQGEFWDYHDKLWENQKNLTTDKLKKIAQELGLSQNQFNSCLEEKQTKSTVNQDIEEGNILLISGTPHFYLNSQELFGLATLEDFQKIIEIELSK